MSRYGWDVAFDTSTDTPCSDLLDAVLSFREVVRAALSESTRKLLDRGKEVYIGVLAAGGWECKHLRTSDFFSLSILTAMANIVTVATLTVMALGAAVVPMCKMIRTFPNEIC